MPGVERALATADVPEPSRRFMRTTFGFIATGKPHVVGAALALGREQIIPPMFRALMAKMGIAAERAPRFHYYLERHIHLDEDFHAPMSLRLLESLCGGQRRTRRRGGRRGAPGHRSAHRLLGRRCRRHRQGEPL